MQLEDSTHVLAMVTGARTRGRKPAGYTQITSVEGVLELVLTVEGAEG